MSTQHYVDDLANSLKETSAVILPSFLKEMAPAQMIGVEPTNGAHFRTAVSFTYAYESFMNLHDHLVEEGVIEAVLDAEEAKTMRLIFKSSQDQADSELAKIIEEGK